MDYVYGILIGALAVVVAQGVFKYNLTTTILGLFGQGESYAASVQAKFLAGLKKDVNKL